MHRYIRPCYEFDKIGLAGTAQCGSLRCFRNASLLCWRVRQQSGRIGAFVVGWMVRATLLSNAQQDVVTSCASLPFGGAFQPPLIGANYAAPYRRGCFNTLFDHENVGHKATSDNGLAAFTYLVRSSALGCPAIHSIADAVE